MSRFAEPIRVAVAARAGDRCEYCRLPTRGQVATFPIDHIAPQSAGGPDTVDFPDYFPERRITLRRNSALIGRRNRNQGVDPEIDLGIHPIDRGVSTQHAVLRVRDSGLTVTDLGSTNGTTLNDSDELLVNGEETPLTDGDQIHVGAWTTITVVRDS